MQFDKVLKVLKRMFPIPKIKEAEIKKTIKMQSIQGMCSLFNLLQRG